MKYEPAWHLTGPKPYEVQLEALRRCHDHQKFGMFLEQGLGKTALQLNDYVENFAELDTIMVVCPNSFKRDWTLAPAEWGLEFSTGYWPKDEICAGSASTPRLNVMNFEAARSSGYDHLAHVMDKRPCLLVVDESSAIKNFKSQTARAILDLSRRAKGVRLLNGTPMSQNVMDLVAQLKCLGELDKVNPYAFRNKFAVLGGFMGKQVTGVKNEADLHAILDRCSFRALKRDWSDLPEKIYTPVRLEMTNRQLKLYRQMLEDLIVSVNSHDFVAMMVLTAMEKLRQIASGILLDGDVEAMIEPPERNPKIKATLDIIDSGQGKTIIVHYYTKIGSVIFEEMKKKGLNPSYLRGGMKPEEVTEQKAKFNTDPTCRVKVAQISASSRAHTLIAGEGNDRCHRMIFFDQTFSLLDRLQMEDRIHRGAQDKACTYYDLLLSPIDQAQLDAIHRKQDMASMVVDAVRALYSGAS